MSSKSLLESILSALSNEVRAEVLKLISREGPLSFTEIMEKLEMNPKTDAGKFGYHLRMLTEAELLLADEASGKYYLTLFGQEPPPCGTGRTRGARVGSRGEVRRGKSAA